ncbi:MAG TPA: DinB family protein [Candidatus Dormibacteraeota bacterium]
MGPTLLEAYRYHAWANQKLFDALAPLSDEQLQWTTPGTYGSIADTLQHLVSAQQRYVIRLSGGTPQPAQNSEFPGVTEVRDMLAQSDAELLGIAERIPADQWIEGFDNGTFRGQAGVVLVQALHHGNDHRTHVCSILGAHGIQYPEMDVWAYGFDEGYFVPVE